VLLQLSSDHLDQLALNLESSEEIKSHIDSFLQEMSSIVPEETVKELQKMRVETLIAPAKERIKALHKHYNKEKKQRAKERTESTESIDLGNV